MSKHTPGPWMVLPMKHYIHIHHGKWKVCDVFPEAAHGGVGWETANTNARLISAAPDLLEALISLHDAQNGPPLLADKTEWHAAMNKAVAAIAKARGEG